MAIAYLGTNQIGSGGENNVIESISVNNVTQAISNKNVNITVPSAPGTLTTTSTTALSTATSEALSGSINLHKVAKTGTYSDLVGKPTIPVVNDSTITVQMNGATVDTFTTNAGSAKTINLGGNYVKYVLCNDEATYNAIATKDSGTLYLIPE